METEKSLSSPPVRRQHGGNHLIPPRCRVRTQRGSTTSLTLRTLGMAVVMAASLTFGSEASAASQPAAATHITVRHNSVKLSKVLDEIERKTDCLFIYNKSINVDRRVSVNARGASLRETLDKLFSGTGITYRIDGNYIVLSDADRKTSPRHNSSHNRQLQQEGKKTVKGMVYDANGDPIIGATVTEKGTTNAAVTDIDGLFTLNVTPGAHLTVTYLGYLPKDISTDGRSELKISLEENSEQLEEVVVVGYGTMRKKDLTGAVGAIKGSDIAARKTTQLSTALQGAAAGVMVTRDNSAPGATASIKVRGVTTIGDSSPLVIVDGVPGDINQVNPDDVENMTVLKDAASASIYGSRAAAGVIVITTKRAKENDLSLSYNFEYGMDIPTVLPKYVGAKRFMEMVNETRYNDNHDGGWFQTYTEDEVNNWVEYNKTNPDKYPITDWQDVILKSSSSRQTHTVNIAGGSKVVKTKASFRYDNADGLYFNRGYKRYMMRVNNDFVINKFLEAHIDINYKRSISTEPLENPLTLISRAAPPVYAVKWSDGRWGDVKDGANVMAKIVDGGDKSSQYNRISGKVGLDVMPIKGLKISAIVAPTYNFDKFKTFRKQVPFTYADDPNTVRGYMEGFRLTKLTENRNDSYDVTSQLFANYAAVLGQHEFTAMAGYEDYYSRWENLSASRDQYLLTNYPFLDIGPQDYRDNSGNAQEYAYRSFFGRLTYNYANRYMFQANFRRDGSSRFAKENRWANFPSFSAGWIPTEENFIKKLNWNWLSYMKIRGSWGTLGNERIGSYYPYQASLNFGSALFYNGSDIISVTTAAQQYYAVRDITWETTETWDVGVDAHFLDGRLSFSFDYYKKYTKDMLLSLEIPKFIGYDNPSVNAGRMNTKGFDLEIGWRDHVGDFSYSVSGNLSDFVSKMGDLGGTEFLGDQVKKEGSEFNEWYGYKSDGLFLTEEDLKNSPKMNENTKVGDIKYKDISGPDGVPDGKISSEYDRVLLGGSLPRYMFGLNLGASWKGIDLSVMFQGVGSQNSRIYETMVEGLRYNYGNFPSLIDGKYWSEKNSDAQNAAAVYPRLTVSNKNSNMVMSDYWMFNGRYLRLKNLTLGYTLPKSLVKTVMMENVRIYVSGSDLFSLSNYPTGWDPESNVEGYPITTSIIFGVNVNF